MRPSRLCGTLATVFLLSAVLSLGAVATSGLAWQSAAGYPVEEGGIFGVSGQQCVSTGQYIHCVGGTDPTGEPRSAVYSSASTTSSGNITGWKADDSYHGNIANQSCVASSGYVYCVGGTYDSSYDDVDSAYFAPINGNGTLGFWFQTTSYPTPIDSESCVASSGYIYCVGGYNETYGMSADALVSNSVWFAPLSSNGIGKWTQTMSYPSGIYLPSCAAGAGYIYCVGGVNSNANPLSIDYYSALSSSGVGPWYQTTSYQVNAKGQSCVVSGGNIYCVGGEKQNSFASAAYYAPASSAGIGKWSQASSYPLAADTDCVVASGNLYCIGGFEASSSETNGVYFASLASLSGTTSTNSSSATAVSTSSTSASSSTTTSSTGIPEFPFQLGLVTVATLAVVAAFVLARRYSTSHKG